MLHHRPHQRRGVGHAVGVARDGHLIKESDGWVKDREGQGREGCGDGCTWCRMGGETTGLDGWVDGRMCVATDNKLVTG